MPRLIPVCAAVLVLGLAGCSGSGDPGAPAGEAAPHTHGAGGAAISMLVGDGTRDYEVGYTLADVALPSAAGEPGRVSFVVLDHQDRPVTDYIPEQTKDLHLYVVRADLAVFRHLHPTRSESGTWSAPLTLPEAGDYRVIAEFVARDEGGNGDAVMLGGLATVPGDWTTQDPGDAAASDDGVVNVAIPEPLTAGPAGVMRLRVRDAAGRPTKLGTYLGAYAHVTAFQLETGSVAHLHPLGPPEVTEAGTWLTFHTEVEQTGDYLAFVQVRVDGFVHTLAVPTQVRAPASLS